MLGSAGILAQLRLAPFALCLVGLPALAQDEEMSEAERAFFCASFYTAQIDRTGQHRAENAKDLAEAFATVAQRFSGTNLQALQAEIAQGASMGTIFLDGADAGYPDSVTYVENGIRICTEFGIAQPETLELFP